MCGGGCLSSGSLGRRADPRLGAHGEGRLRNELNIAGADRPGGARVIYNHSNNNTITITMVVVMVVMVIMVLIVRKNY